jgi:DNA-binding CsgD family transcriptional regulator
LYITIPLWGYYLFDVDKKCFKNIPILVVTEAVIENILLAHSLLVFLYISRIVFYILLTAPIFIKKKNKYEKNSLERKMQTVTKVTVTLFVAFMASLIPLSPFIFEISYTASVFWAVFTLSYQIPGLVYFINWLAGKEALSGNRGISSLTKKENEIALAICSGLKYAEIAEKQFITRSTVKYHTFSIYRKLGIKNNRELMQIFMDSPIK